MSDCQRWEPLDESTMRQSADGGWVLIGDYSFLKREAHILRLTCQDLQSQNAGLKAEVERLALAGSQSIEVGAKLREMVGDHHWSMEFDRVRADWYHASRGVLSRRQNTNTPPTAV